MRVARFTLFAALLCFVAAPPFASSASVGEKLEDAKQTDFFKFFGLAETGVRTREGALAVVEFRPRAGAFRQLVQVLVSTDEAGVIRAARLTVDRAFIDDRANGVFARDISKSFLRFAVPRADAAAISDLANEIEFPKELPGYEIERTRPDPKLPAQPTRGYQVYLGKLTLSEEKLTQTVVRLENARDGGKAVLRITVGEKRG